MTNASATTPASVLHRVKRYFQDAFRRLTLALISRLDQRRLRDEQEVRSRGERVRRELRKMDGGMLESLQAAKLLRVRPEVVDEQRAAGRLLGVEGPDGWLYPAWQFTDQGMLPGFEDTLRELGDEDTWSKLLFFLEHDAAVDGERPLDLLRKNRVEEVMRAAELYGEHAAV